MRMRMTSGIVIFEQCAEEAFHGIRCCPQKTWSCAFWRCCLKKVQSLLRGAFCHVCVFRVPFDGCAGPRRATPCRARSAAPSPSCPTSLAPPPRACSRGCSRGTRLNAWAAGPPAARRYAATPSSRALTGSGWRRGSCPPPTGRTSSPAAAWRTSTSCGRSRTWGCPATRRLRAAMTLLRALPTSPQASCPRLAACGWPPRQTAAAAPRALALARHTRQQTRQGWKACG